eukprot:COSAG04_NODE_7320_length_1147_cov_6.041031_1_plen_382_part_11
MIVEAADNPVLLMISVPPEEEVSPEQMVEQAKDMAAVEAGKSAESPGKKRWARLKEATLSPGESGASVGKNDSVGSVGGKHANGSESEDEEDPEEVRKAQLAAVAAGLSRVVNASVTELGQATSRLQSERQAQQAEDRALRMGLGAVQRKLARAKKLNDAKMDKEERLEEQRIQVEYYASQLAVRALDFLLRLCEEGIRQQEVIVPEKLANEMRRLGSVANYDREGDGVGATLLHVAAEGGHAPLLAEVIRPNGVDACRNDGTTPLYAASRLGQMEAADWLLLHKADVNHARKDGCTPALAAAAGGHLEMLRNLCAAGGSLLSQSYEGVTALAIAAARVEVARRRKQEAEEEAREDFMRATSEQVEGKSPREADLAKIAEQR